MNPAVFAALVLVGSFLLGSIPFGYVIALLFYRTDIRKSGSGNIGAMNALRTIGKGGALSVLVLDAGKGFLPVFVLLHDVRLAAVCGIAVVLGHCFSPWLGWKGGKGVATSFGVIGALSWPALLVVLITYVLGAFVFSKYSSVGSMLSNLVSPIALYVFTHEIAFVIYGVFAALFIIWTHRENVARLRAGTEGPLKLFR